MLFIGLDLAWGRKNTSGGCVLRYDGQSPAAVVDVRDTLRDDNEIMGWIGQWDAVMSDGLLIGVDAPLLVPNETGMRLCEAELGRRFVKHQAGPHPANRQLYGGDVRGERLVAELAGREIRHDPYLSAPRRQGVRQVMEVFPHPAHIVLFGLTRTLKYKAKPGRDYAGRWTALNDYARHLRLLTFHDPPLRLPPDWPASDSTGIIGQALKRYEDSLDALTCAYIVYWYWWHGATGAQVVGDMTTGYIVIPQGAGASP